MKHLETAAYRLLKSAALPLSWAVLFWEHVHQYADLMLPKSSTPVPSDKIHLIGIEDGFDLMRSVKMRLTAYNRIWMANVHKASKGTLDTVAGTVGAEDNRVQWRTFYAKSPQALFETLQRLIDEIQSDSSGEGNEDEGPDDEGPMPTPPTDDPEDHTVDDEETHPRVQNRRRLSLMPV
jgi:hypothetical protein